LKVSHCESGGRWQVALPPPSDCKHGLEYGPDGWPSLNLLDVESDGDVPA